MKTLNEKVFSLLIIFFICTLGIVISFLSIALVIDILIWLLTGTFDLTKTEMFKVIRIGCIVGGFTGFVFVIARLLRLKGF
ncbi:hypothetical protein GBFDFA_13455 [Edwardsiella anguillarum]|uniref:Uncharacterized protein n=1 Tax=Edwardsiella ictaluri TaxID=67780 RepID=A0ABY8GHW9_EDWIC|nr:MULTISPECIES: hypothetical protein [Edwardsiella]AKM47087.1 hypothetical protein QY76_06835 [Edwardsiella sp. EA181011]GAJ67361.1 hypothetical protein MA13_contig00005-0141 [Edwardsiella piscicida]ELV7529569.1 hypothetical protein [Edwardsiella ictaluri]KMQ73813.1 hypothetical protein ABY58_17090 [Edwardsiella ictaluri]KOO53948.1 hypothetical protein ACS33_17115 [Edwardsiella ictaluri]